LDAFADVTSSARRRDNVFPLQELQRDAVAGAG
jgi:hypothetical protein